MIFFLSSFFSLTVKAQCATYPIHLPGAVGASQVTWQLLNSFSVIVASGGAQFSQNFCLPDDSYTLNMLDSGGDGWGALDWFINDQLGNFDFDTTLGDGSTGSDQFSSGSANCGGGGPNCPPGQNEYTITVDNGNNANEVYWELYDSNGNLITSGVAPYDVNICLVNGCYTLFMYDAVGDGWTGESWTREDVNGIAVYTTFLFNGDFGQESFVVGSGNCATSCTLYTIEVNNGVDAIDVSWELYDEFGVIQAVVLLQNFNKFVCLMGVTIGSCMISVVMVGPMKHGPSTTLEEIISIKLF